MGEFRSEVKKEGGFMEYLHGMADVHDKETRSDIMSRIKSKNTTPEMQVRRLLHASGFRYSLHNKNLPGKPDIVLKKYKTVVFVNGCFWHGHKNCKNYVMPKVNKEFWYTKIEVNVNRDRRNLRRLRKLRWKVIVVWGCELRPSRLEKSINRLVVNILS